MERTYSVHITKMYYVLSIISFVLIASPVKTNAKNLTNVISVSANGSSSMAIKEDGTVWIWGSVFNEITENMDFETTRPIQLFEDITTKTPFRNVITAGYISHSSIVTKRDGTTLIPYTGDDPRNPNFKAYPLKNENGIFLTVVIKVTAGTGHDLILRGDGTVWALGDNNYGQLGDGTLVSRAGPVQVIINPDTGEPLTDIVEIAAGNLYSVALKKDGTVWLWGTMASQLDGFQMTSKFAVQALNDSISGQPIKDVIDITVSGIDFIAVRKDGTVWKYQKLAFDFDPNVQPRVCDCPPGTDKPRERDLIAPSQIFQDSDSKVPLTNVMTIDGDWLRSVALKTDGTVWQWGYNEGISHKESETKYAVQVMLDLEKGVPLTNVASISAGEAHTLALKRDGTVWAWGLNESGQLGINNVYSSKTPVQVVSPQSEHTQN